MNQELQVQLQRVLKQKTREAVCAYLAKSDGKLAQDFLVKVRNFSNDDCIPQLRECLDGHFYVEFKHPDDAFTSSTVLYADNFASPHLIAFMRFCSGAESMNPAECAVFVTARLHEIAKKHSKDEKLLFELEMQRNHTAAIVERDHHRDSRRHIALINDLLTGYIKEFLL